MSLAVQKEEMTPRYIRTSIIVFIEMIILIALLIYQYFRILPPPDKLVNTEINFYDNSGELFYEQSYPLEQSYVSLHEISPHVITGFIATEDQDFYKHLGFDLSRIAVAIVTNIKEGEAVLGASTITQQYARNLFNDFDKTLSRKLREAFLTVQLEINYDKDTILEGYLNTINFGHGNYGIQDAALFYFNKQASDLTLAEAAILVGIPKGPTYYSPLNYYENAKRRQNIVLTSMLNCGYISQIQYETALNETLTIVGVYPEEFESPAPYYIDGVLAELDLLLSTDQTYPHLNVYTSFDPTVQEAVNDSITATIKKEDVQTAVIVMQPNTGEVLALSGGVNYEDSQYNRALYSERQIGSMMKPILYYASLEYGLNPSTTFTSEVTTFYFNDGQDTYTPANYAHAYPNEEISMANAVAVSDNIYALKLHDFLGYSVLANTSQRLNISTPIDLLPSSILGTASINIMELTEAYAIFANEGSIVEHSFINEVTDEFNQSLYLKSEPSHEQILDSTKTFVLNEMLTGMFDTNQTNHLAPTAQSISSRTTRKYAGKTGTTNTDSWITAYNPDLISTVWIGYDEGKELLGTDIHQYAKEIWLDVMETSLANTPINWYETPDDVVGIMIEPLTGAIATDQCSRQVMLYYELNNQPHKRYVAPEPLIQVNQSND